MAPIVPESVLRKRRALDSAATKKIYKIGKSIMSWFFPLLFVIRFLKVDQVFSHVDYFPIQLKIYVEYGSNEIHQRYTIE